MAPSAFFSEAKLRRSAKMEGFSASFSIGLPGLNVERHHGTVEQIQERRFHLGRRPEVRESGWRGLRRGDLGDEKRQECGG